MTDWSDARDSARLGYARPSELPEIDRKLPECPKVGGAARMPEMLAELPECPNRPSLPERNLGPCPAESRAEAILPELPECPNARMPTPGGS